MKPGRPKSHIKPTFISLEKGGRTIFYELDSKGALVLESGRFKIHHVKESEEPISEPPSPYKAIEAVAIVDVLPVHHDMDELEPVTPFGRGIDVFGSLGDDMGHIGAWNLDQ